MANASFKPLSFVDALFTATSATCVTGLIVVDTGRDLSSISQWIVLLLIQLGGIGVMTFTTALPLLAGQRIGLRQRMLMKGGLGMETPSGAVRLLIQILKLTVFAEALGVLFLFFAFLQSDRPLRAAHLAVFHTISAFCNAGFSLFSDNLESFAATWAVPGIVMALIVAGGLGFPFYAEVASSLRTRRKLSPYSKLVVLVTLVLIASGGLLFSVTEWNNALKGLSPGLKVWNALFCAVTPRTAGFDTISVNALSSASILLTILLMIVGASSGSTGGGVKVTTIGVLFATMWSHLRGREDAVLWGRAISHTVLIRSISMVLIYLLTLFFSSFILLLIEPFPFRCLVFEVVSALGTVGLSTGITGDLSPAGKLVLIALMFWGRVGLLTFMYSLLKKDHKGSVSYPEATFIVG